LSKARGAILSGQSRTALLLWLWPWYDPVKENGMIELTEEQLYALERPGAVPQRLVNPKTQQRFVLLPEEQYERLASYDLSPWSDEERDLLRAETVEALGWEGMEAYQEDEP